MKHKAVVRRIELDPLKMGKAFDELMKFIRDRRPQRFEILAERTIMERTKARRMVRRLRTVTDRLILTIKPFKPSQFLRGKQARP